MVGVALWQEFVGTQTQKENKETLPLVVLVDGYKILDNLLLLCYCRLNTQQECSMTKEELCAIEKAHEKLTSGDVTLAPEVSTTLALLMSWFMLDGVPNLIKALKQEQTRFDNFDIVEFVEKIQSLEKDEACIFAAVTLIPPDFRSYTSEDIDKLNQETLAAIRANVYRKEETGWATQPITTRKMD